MTPLSNAHGSILQGLIYADPQRMHILRLVQSLGLPQAWVAAGFVRSAVWDALHHRRPCRSYHDVDVVWFDPARASAAADTVMEARLNGLAASIPWSVRNQARMHLRNGDDPYRSVADAMRHWPETATAIAVRWTGSKLETLAPFGLEDLFTLTLRPTPVHQRADRHGQYLSRIKDKQWLARWPLLRLADPPAAAGADWTGSC